MSAQSALSCTGKCSAAMRDQNCTGSREVQSAREQKPQHRRLFPTKSIKHRTPCHHFRARFWRLTLFQLNSITLTLSCLWLFNPPFVLRADQSLSSERLRGANQGGCPDFSDSLCIYYVCLLQHTMFDQNPFAKRFMSNKDPSTS